MNLTAICFLFWPLLLDFLPLSVPLSWPKRITDWLDISGILLLQQQLHHGGGKHIGKVVGVSAKPLDHDQKVKRSVSPAREACQNTQSVMDCRLTWLTWVSESDWSEQPRVSELRSGQQLSWDYRTASCYQATETNGCCARIPNRKRENYFLVHPGNGPARGPQWSTTNSFCHAWIKTTWHLGNPSSYCFYCRLSLILAKGVSSPSRPRDHNQPSSVKNE